VATIVVQALRVLLDSDPKKALWAAGWWL